MNCRPTTSSARVLDHLVRDVRQASPQTPTWCWRFCDVRWHRLSGCAGGFGPVRLADGVWRCPPIPLSSTCRAGAAAGSLDANRGRVPARRCRLRERALRTRPLVRRGQLKKWVAGDNGQPSLSEMKIEAMLLIDPVHLCESQHIRREDALRWQTRAGPNCRPTPRSFRVCGAGLWPTARRTAENGINH